MCHFETCLTTNFKKSIVTRLRDGAYFFLKGGAQDTLCLTRHRGRGFESRHVLMSVLKKIIVNLKV